MVASLKAAILETLDELEGIPLPRLMDERYEKLRSLGCPA
jgi:acetyl-CoA carboxylase alpha subunit